MGVLLHVETSSSWPWRQLVISLGFILHSHNVIFRTISTRIFYLKGHGQNFGEGNKIILQAGTGELDGPIKIWTKLDAGNFA